MSATAPAATVALVTSAAVPIALLGADLEETLLVWPVLAGVAIVAAEAVVAAPQAGRLEPPSGPWLRFRAAEWIAIFVLARGITLLDRSAQEVLAVVRAWWRAPLETLDRPTVLVFAGLVAAWYVAGSTATDVRRSASFARSVPEDQEPLTRTLGRFLALAAVASVASAVHVRQPDAVGTTISVVALVAFLVAGLAGISGLRFARLRAVWASNGVREAGDLAALWRVQTALFVIAVGVVAALLPTPQRPFGGLALHVVTAVGRFFEGLVVRRRDRVDEMEAVEPTPVEPDRAPPEWLADPVEPDAVPITPRSPPEWIGAVWPYVVWGAIALLAGYALWGYVRRRPRLVAGLRRIRPLRSLRSALGWTSLIGVVRRCWAAIARLVRRRSDGGRRRADSERARGVTGRRAGDRGRRAGERARVRLLEEYFAVLRTAEAVGRPRRETQTPFEYELWLVDDVADADLALSRLTAAFVRARYDDRPVADADVATVREDARAVVVALTTKGSGHDEHRSDQRAGGPGGDG